VPATAGSSVLTDKYLLSDKRNASMRFVRYTICCNCASVSMCPGTDILATDDVAERRESLHNGRPVILTGLLPFWW